MPFNIDKNMWSLQCSCSFCFNCLVSPYLSPSEHSSIIFRMQLSKGAQFYSRFKLQQLRKSFKPFQHVYLDFDAYMNFAQTNSQLSLEGNIYDLPVACRIHSLCISFLLLLNQCIPGVYFQPHMPTCLLAFQNILEDCNLQEQCVATLCTHHLGG